ncbi:T9SS type A sorting domain-containing protein [Mesoflavibacter zeaxanthinifaciens]|uniref:T9SS type A sorting domain-containing protein n=1 Tax=Mesoflavibacter zeaxanthinifaciens TaxID=393060 RepID=UPI003A909F5A
MTLSLFSFSQDPRLFENTWYLHVLVINGIENNPPTNNEVPYVPAEFIESNSFSTSVCGSDGLGQIIYNGPTAFTLQNINFFTNTCVDDSNQNFDELYQLFWIYNLAGNSSYTITDVGMNRTLTIVNSNGDEAIYGNGLLSTSTIDVNSFSIFPNPAKDIIYIKKRKNTSISKIRIFDINGKLVCSITSFNKDIQKLDIQSLHNGIYFLSIKNNRNQFFIQKIIKL